MLDLGLEAACTRWPPQNRKKSEIYHKWKQSVEREYDQWSANMISDNSAKRAQHTPLVVMTRVQAAILYRQCNAEFSYLCRGSRRIVEQWTVLGVDSTDEVILRERPANEYLMQCEIWEEIVENSMAEILSRIYNHIGWHRARAAYSIYQECLKCQCRKLLTHRPKAGHARTQSKAVQTPVIAK